MTSIPAAKHAPSRGQIVAAVLCAVSALVIFHFFGNATRGYVKTTSMFWWWISQWLDPNAETEHGWLILGLSGWLWWRNLAIADRGLRIADPTKPETGNRKPGSEDVIQETGNDLEQLLRKSSGRTPSALPFPVSGFRFQVSKSPVSENPQSAIRDPQLEGSQSPWPAVAAMLGGLALHALGFVAQQTRISILAFLLFTWGVVRLAGGRRWGDAAMFPLGFMMFAIPISVLDEIGLPLRLWVTTAGERIAHLAGIDVVRSGTQLVAPDGRFHYDVAAPCSGVRSLMALMALSVLVGYLNFRSWWRRALVVGLCFPLVYLGNVCRIVAIVFAAQAGGPEWGDRAHEIMGYGVFAIVLGGVMLAVAWIHRWWPEAPRRGEGRGKGTKGESLTREEKSGDGARFTAAAVVMLVAVAEMFFLHRLAQMPSRAEAGVVLAADGLNPVELPAFLGTEWIGQRAEVSATERDILPADTGFSRKNYAFVGDRRHDVFLSIVLSGRDRTSIHRPELCLVGQGWTIEGAMQHSFRNATRSGAGSDFRATVLRVRREVPSPRGRVVVPQLVAYWFVGGDSIVASHWKRFLHDAWNRVTRARADRWAYVLMQTDATDGEAAALARMQAVLDGTMPVFQKP